MQVTPIFLELSPQPKGDYCPNPLLSHDRTTHHASLSTLEPRPVVAVIGVGYVGTHLVEAFAHHYKVVAFDLSKNNRLLKVAEQLNDLPAEFTSSALDITQASHFLISVPTLLNIHKTINTTYPRSAIATVEQYAKPGSTVFVESSVAVGITRSLVGPLIRSNVGMSSE